MIMSPVMVILSSFRKRKQKRISIMGYTGGQTLRLRKNSKQHLMDMFCFYTDSLDFLLSNVENIIIVVNDDLYKELINN